MKRPLVLAVLCSLGGGGAEKVFVDLVAALRDRWDFRVVLTAARDRGIYGDRLEKLGVPVDFLPVYRRFSRFRKMIPLRRLALRTKPDVVLSFLWTNNAVVPLALAGTGIPVVTSERNDLRSEFAKDDLHPGLYHRLYRFVLRTNLARTVVAVSGGIADELRNDFRAKPEIVAIGNGVDVGKIAEAAREPLPPEAGPVFEKPVVAAVGRLSAQKNLSLLLRAVARGGPALSGANVVLVGQGPLEAELKREAEELGLSGRVFFAGFQANPHAWTARASVYAMSSDFEGFPNALAEAMFANGHCVSTDCPTGPSEIVEDGKSGLLVPPGDEAALAAALERMLSYEGLRETCARNAKAWAEANSVGRKAELWNAVLEKAKESRK